MHIRGVNIYQYDLCLLISLLFIIILAILILNVIKRTIRLKNISMRISRIMMLIYMP